MTDDLLVRRSDLLSLCDKAWDATGRILEGLGDELANERPGFPGGNSPYAIATHMCGVAEYWAGAVALGRADHRDRDAEFVATGAVTDLLSRLRAAKAQLRADATVMDPGVATAAPPPTSRADFDPTHVGGVLLHVYEELAQHLGHLEITRDVLRASRTELVG